MIIADAYLPTKTRLLCISQLCFALATLFWVFSYPFLGAVYHSKAQLLVYESVLNDEMTPSLFSIDTIEYFQERYQTLRKAHTAPFGKKCTIAISLFLTLSPFKLGWIFLSIALSITLLLKMEGSNQVLWLLPVLILLFSIENLSYPENKRSDLFPSEHYLASRYLKGPIKGSISEQYEQLKSAWSQYLIVEWANEMPSNDTDEQSIQERKGSILFNADRLMKSDSLLEISSAFQQRSSPLWLLLQVTWNCLFCLFARIPKREIRLAQ